MSEDVIDIQFLEQEEGWRVADLMPGEACLLNREVYIRLGIGTKSDVELHTIDPYNMTPSDKGASLKKYFFFHVNTASVVTLTGDKIIIPYRIRVQVLERITFAPDKTYIAREKTVIDDKTREEENGTQEATIDTFGEDTGNN